MRVNYLANKRTKVNLKKYKISVQTDKASRKIISETTYPDQNMNTDYHTEKLHKKKF